MKQQARKLYEHNKAHVAVNRIHMSWKELVAYCKKQDALYKIFNGIEDK